MGSLRQNEQLDADFPKRRVVLLDKRVDRVIAALLGNRTVELGLRTVVVAELRLLPLDEAPAVLLDGAAIRDELAEFLLHARDHGSDLTGFQPVRGEG